MPQQEIMKQTIMKTTQILIKDSKELQFNTKQSTSIHDRRSSHPAQDFSNLAESSRHIWNTSYSSSTGPLTGPSYIEITLLSKTSGISSESGIWSCARIRSLNTRGITDWPWPVFETGESLRTPVKVARAYLNASSTSPNVSTCLKAIFPKSTKSKVC